MSRRSPSRYGTPEKVDLRKLPYLLSYSTVGGVEQGIERSIV